MNIPIKTVENTESGTIALPAQFSELIREDLISRSVHALEANARQPYGAKEGAGMRPSAELSRRRKKYRGSYGQGISRVPRKVLTRRGTRFYFVGALAPGTVGGRRAHPPKAEKQWTQKVNAKENRKAIRSALSATINKELVAKRGHLVPAGYPFVLDNKIETVEKTKDIKKTLVTLGLKEDLLRTALRKIRAGKGTMRGRKYKIKKGALLVVGNDCKLMKSAKNVRGIDIVPVKSLNAKLLAPGCHPGRLTLFTKNAIEIMQKEKLFM